MPIRKKPSKKPPPVPAPTGQTLPVPRDDATPLWAPDGVDLQSVPQEIRHAAAQIVQPVYRQFVLDADDPLEKSLGVTVVHLLWLELLQQHDMKRQYLDVTAPLKLSESYHDAISQHLRIIEGKVRVGHLLARLRESRNRWYNSDDEPPQPGKIEIC